MVVCDIGMLQKNEIRAFHSVKKAKILTFDEWIRINSHLSIPNETKTLEDGNKLKRTGISHSLIPDESGIDIDVENVKKKFEFKGNKEEIVKKAKDILFENKDYVRRIGNGLKLSSVLHERNRQIDFNRTIERERKISEKEKIEKLNREIINYEEELKRKALNESEKKESFKKALDKQISEKFEKLKEYQLEKAIEKNNLINMIRESEAMTEEERLINLRKKQKFKKDFIKCWQIENEIRERCKAKQLEEEEKNKIYADIASEMNSKRRQNENSRFRIKNFKGTLVEGATIEKPVERPSDGDKKLSELLQSREFQRRNLINDLLKNKKKYEKQAENERENYKLERKRSALRRMEKFEADEIRKEKEREERLKNMKNAMKFYMIQCMEKEEERKREKEFDLFYAPDFNPENELINNYCRQIIRMIEKMKRPKFPVLAAINEIKKDFGLIRKKNSNFLKSNVPIGN